MDGGDENHSGVHDHLEVHVASVIPDGFVVKVSQDVHPGHVLPAGAAAAFRGRRLGGGRRQHDGVGEDVILKHVAPVGAVLGLQQRQKFQPAGNRKECVCPEVALLSVLI